VVERKQSKKLVTNGSQVLHHLPNAPEQKFGPKMQKGNAMATLDRLLLALWHRIVGAPAKSRVRRP